MADPSQLAGVAHRPLAETEPLTPEQGPVRRPRRSALRLGLWLPAVVAIAAFLGLWEVVAYHDHFLAPTLAQVADQLGSHPGFYLTNTLYTLSEAVPGLLIGFGAALVLAVSMNQWRVVSRALFPLAVVINVTPLIAIAPVLLVAGGFGRFPHIVVTALIVFFPALINAIAGLRSVDPGADEVLRTLHASRWERLWRLQLPASLPYLLAAGRVGAPLAVIGASVSEMVAGGSSGIGLHIAQDASNSALAGAWAGIATLVAFGLVLSGLAAVLEQRVLQWRGFR
jgi:NitT/TauT family transport system permease protein